MSARLRSLGFLVSALLAVTPRLSAIEQFKSLASLPLNSSPAPTLIQGQDGNLYGVLMYTDVDNEGATNGAVYQLSTTGSLKYLYRFPWAPDLDTNATGGEPANLLAMAKDGFLYGVTRFGGHNGSGVFYRLSTNGEYTVLAHFPRGVMLGNGLRGCVVGPDNAIYSYYDYEGLVRLGFDGAVQSVHAPFSTSPVSIQAMNEDGSEIAVCWTKPRSLSVEETSPRTLYVRILELPSCTVKESREIDYFGTFEDDPQIVYVGQDEILALSYAQSYNPLVPGRLVSFDRSGSNPTVIAEIDGERSVSTGPLLPRIQRILVTADGSIFFTAGDQTKGEIGLGGGTEIFRLKRNGDWKQVASLDGYPLAAWCEGARGKNLYGVSWGPLVVETPETEPTVSALSAQSALRTPVKANRSSSRVRRAAFRYQTDPANGNFLPIAKPDRYVLSAKPSVTSMTLPVLRNDRDPESEALELVDVASPKNGAATIVPGPAGKPPVISYTPDSGPRLSDMFTYSVRDSSGGTAIGEVSIRGILNGKFRQSPAGSTPTVSLDSLTFNVSRSGKVTGVVKVNGRNVPLSGKFGYDNMAHLSRRIHRTFDVVIADLKLTNSEGARHLRYKVTFSDQVFEGEILAE